MYEPNHIDASAIKHRRKALNAPNRIILRTYSAIILQLHQRGIKGPLARDSAIQITAASVSKTAGVTISPNDVEDAIARG